jgi:hypothetical protein
MEDGTWRIPSDYLDRVSSYQRAQVAKHPPEILKRSHLTLSQMRTAQGATWLDEHLRDFGDHSGIHGFASEVETARASRRAFLIKNGVMEKGQPRLSEDGFSELRARDLGEAGAQLATQLGKAYRAAPESGRINGVYTRTIDRPSGRFAVIEKSKEFSLVPWRKVMDRNLGKSVSGLVRGNQISWTLTKGRSIS